MRPLLELLRSPTTAWTSKNVHKKKANEVDGSHAQFCLLYSPKYPEGNLVYPIPCAKVAQSKAGKARSTLGLATLLLQGKSCSRCPSHRTRKGRKKKKKKKKGAWSVATGTGSNVALSFRLLIAPTSHSKTMQMSISS